MNQRVPDAAKPTKRGNNVTLSLRERDGVRGKDALSRSATSLLRFMEKAGVRCFHIPFSGPMAKASVNPLSSQRFVYDLYDPMNVVIANRQKTKKINLRLLKQIVSVLFDELKIDAAELGVHLVGSKEMAIVNWKYLQHEGSTDVITFDYSGEISLKNSRIEPLNQRVSDAAKSTRRGISVSLSPGEKVGVGGKDTLSCSSTSLFKVRGTRNTGWQLHGELFVCVDDAMAQAKQFQTTWQSEIVRYVVHGVLHLVGYDDLKPELRRKMKREENRLVKCLEKRFSLAELSRPAKMDV